MNGLGKWLLDAAKALLSWLLESLRSSGDSLIQAALGVVASFLPDLVGELGSWEAYAEAANFFFPLSETLALASAYGTLWSVVRGVRLAKSLIPTLSS